MLFKKKELSQEQRNILRQQLLEELKNVPEGTKIKYPKTDILDQLIFFRFKKKGVEYKIPIWTGTFLRKIDLSKLSFDNLSDIPMIDIARTQENKYKKELTEEGCKRLGKEDAKRYFEEYMYCNNLYNNSSEEGIIEGKYVVDFSYTNINLKSLNNPEFIIFRYNLEGVDLSEIKLGQSIRSLGCCNLKNTKINIQQFEKNTQLYNFLYRVSSCDLSENDLGNITIDLSNIKYNYDGTNYDREWEKELPYGQDLYFHYSVIEFMYDGQNCGNKYYPYQKYKNTGLKIIYKFPKNERIKYNFATLNEKELLDEKKRPISFFKAEEKYKNNNMYKNRAKLIIEGARKYENYMRLHHLFIEKIKRGDFDGCYLNGRLINSKLFNKNQTSYEELMSTITSPIEELKSKSKK